MLHCFHRGVDAPAPLPRSVPIPPAATPLPEISEGWLEIIEPAWPGDLPPVGEPVPTEPALQVRH